MSCPKCTKLQKKYGTNVKCLIHGITSMAKTAGIKLPAPVSVKVNK